MAAVLWIFLLLRWNACNNYHDIWNQRRPTWFKGGVTNMKAFFIYHPFQNGGRFVWPFRSYGQTPCSFPWRFDSLDIILKPYNFVQLQSNRSSWRKFIVIYRLWLTNWTASKFYKAICFLTSEFYCLRNYYRRSRVAKSDIPSTGRRRVPFIIRWRDSLSFLLISATTAGRLLCRRKRTISTAAVAADCGGRSTSPEHLAAAAAISPELISRTVDRFRAGVAAATGLVQIMDLLPLHRCRRPPSSWWPPINVYIRVSLLYTNNTRDLVSI